MFLSKQVTWSGFDFQRIIPAAGLEAKAEVKAEEEDC